jgi:phosphoserine phosphatase RsbU/P
MLKRLLRFTVCFALGAVLAHAQDVDLSKNTQSVVRLDGLWRFHPGDDPGWADPAFDDSQWALRHADRSWSSQGYPGMGGYAWYRFTVRIPAGSPPLSIWMPPILSGYTLYLDGAQKAAFGPQSPSILVRSGNYMTVPLTNATASASRTIHVAIRVWHSPVWAAYAGGGPGDTGMVGDARLVSAHSDYFQMAVNASNVDFYVVTLLRAVIGLLILGLFLLRPREREYLWFAAIQLFGGADDILNFFRNANGALPIPFEDLADAILSAGFWIAGLLFFSILLKQKRGLWFKIALVFAIVSPLPTPLYWWGWVPVPMASFMTSLLVLPSLVWVLSVLIVRSIRGDADARLLLVPVLLVHGMYLAANVVLDLGQFGFLPRLIDLFSYRIHLIPFDFSLYELFNVLFLVAMMAFLIRRFSRARQQEERLLGEFEAARQVQQILVPEDAPPVPGFQIEAVYLPADSVGGDFFQQIPDGRGGVLIVVGDVAGKGLPAAMMVSMLVGAIRAEAAHSSDPAAMLTTLNERMLGRTQGGFATCLAAHLSADGTLTIANAGHIPPYRNGEALEMNGALPLGITADPGYKPKRFVLAKGDRLTFISDGVLEATSSTGELFGFDRTAAISTQTADQIAKAAEQFGQQDDITVLTLRIAPAEAVHA